jgi:mRNA-degrading endonuclease RelE of RelBE toxin-antitoxin system
MRSALTLLFLIISYNFLLWYITVFDMSPIPLFPEDVYNTVLVLSYNSVLFLSWLFGERHRAVQWIGYLFFIQIVALSVYFGNLEIIVRDLPPVILTFAFVVLFESPTERSIQEVFEERDNLLKEIDRVRRERERVEVHLRLLQEKIKRIEEERKEALSEERSRELEERLKDLQRELESYREKEARLLEANRKLFQLLELVREEGEEEGGRKELVSLRKERKRLIKELLQLQELVDIYSDENEKLKEENRKLGELLRELKLKLETLELELENSKRGADKEHLRSVLRAVMGVELTPRALQELLRLPEDRKRLFVKEIIKLSERKGKEKVEPLSTLPSIFKLKLPGGRIYLKRTKGGWQVVGILDSEDDKEKDRYIRGVLSKIE